LFTQGVNHTALSTDSAVWLPDRRSLCSLVRDEVDRSDFKQPIRLPHHCERSEAIQLAAQRKKKWIASSLTLLAMTSLIETCIHVLAAQTRPRRCMNHPRKEQGAGEYRVRVAPAAASALVEITRVSNHGYAALSRHSLRDGFTA
jgi:hypothetical protein